MKFMMVSSDEQWVGFISEGNLEKYVEPLIKEQ
jgi:xanthine/CO dehydrogenase XdhC/CoxF family maturation factor